MCESEDDAAEAVVLNWDDVCLEAGEWSEGSREKKGGERGNLQLDGQI